MSWLVELAKVDPQLAQGAMVMLGVIALFVACGIGAGLSGLGQLGQTVHEHHRDGETRPDAPSPLFLDATSETEDRLAGQVLQLVRSSDRKVVTLSHLADLLHSEGIGLHQASLPRWAQATVSDTSTEEGKA